MIIKLGYIVQDKVTGLQGIAVAKTEWLYGLPKFAIHPLVGSSEEKRRYSIDVFWFEAQRLKVLWELKKYFIDLETQIANYKDIAIYKE